MADRSAKVRLEVESSQFIAEMNRAAAATEKLAKAGEQAGKAQDRALGGSTRAVRPAITAWEKLRATTGTVVSKVLENRDAAARLGTAWTATGAAMTAFSVAAVRAFADFDKAMSAVAANTGATGDELASLRQAALEAGKATIFNAAESANAINELAKAGVQTRDILGGGLKGALDLAASGQLEVGKAAEIASIAMTQFKKSGGDVPHIADLLAAGANSAVGGVEDLGMALNQAGLVASQSGLSIEETTGTLSAFASAGLIGSDAGTSFKSMLQRLQNPVGQAKTLMERLGITMYDEQGKFVGMADVAGQLHTAMGNMTEGQRNATMSILFGSDAVRAANVLYDQGADGIAKWTDTVNKSGFAADQAAQLTNNLAGDFEQLSGSWETALIGMGSGVSFLLRPLVQGLTNLLNVFNSLPEPVQGFVGALASIAGVAGLAAGGFLLLLPKIVEVREAAKTLGVTFGSLGGKISGAFTGLGPWIAANPVLFGGLVAAVALVTAGIALFAQAQHDAEVRAKELNTAIRDTTDVTKQLDIAARNTAHSGLFGAFDEGQYKAAVEQLKDVGAVLDQLANRPEEIRTRLPGAVKQFRIDQAAIDSLKTYGDELGKIAKDDMPTVSGALTRLKNEFGLSSDQLWTFIHNSSELENALKDQAAASGLAVDDLSKLEQQSGLVEFALSQTAKSAGEFAGDLLQGGDAAKEAADSIDKVTSALQGLDDKIQGMQDATAGYYESIDAAKKVTEQFNGAVYDNVAAFDLSTEQGRAYDKAVRAIAGSTLEMAASQYQADGSIQNLVGNITAGRKAFIDQAVVLGMNRQAAEEYADSLGLVPETVDTVMRIASETDPQVQNQLNQLIQQDGKTTTVRLSVLTDGAKSELDDVFSRLDRAKGEHPTITVDALTTEAMVALDSLGAQVDQLPDGRFQIVYTNKGEVERAVENLESKKDMKIRLGADISEALQNFNLFHDVAKQPATVPVEADTSEADKTIGSYRTRVATPAISYLTTDTSQADASVDTWQVKGNTTVATATLFTNTDPAKTSTDMWDADAASRKPTATLDVATSWAERLVNVWNAFAASRRPQATLTATDGPAWATAQGWFRWASGLNAQTTISAVDRATSVAWNVRNVLAGIPRFVSTVVETVQRFVTGHAGGGAVYGPGPKGVDSLLRMLAPGEHVLTAREVDLLGGQGAVYALRALIRERGGLHGLVPGLANGGAVMASSRVADVREQRVVVVSGAGQTEVVRPVNVSIRNDVRNADAAVLSRRLAHEIVRVSGRF